MIVDFTIHIHFSLWWVIGYLLVGLAVGAVTVYLLRKRAYRNRPTMPRLRPAQLARLVPIWAVGWPVCLIIAIRETLED